MSNLTVNAINGVDVQNIAKQTVRAWVSFNGTGVVAIRKAYNVASITDIGAGVYGVNFTAPMPDANYVGVGNCSTTSGSPTVIHIDTNGNIIASPSINGMVITSHQSGAGSADQLYINMAFFG